MGIATDIEEGLARIIERPFMNRDVFGLIGLEIAIRRLIEKKKKDILGRIVIPDAFSIVIDEGIYKEYEPFVEELRGSLIRSLNKWLIEKGYEASHGLSIDFRAGQVDGKKPFEVSVSYRRVKKADEERGDDGKGGVFIGELINQKTGERFEIQDGAVIGRSDDCTVRLTDETISKRHAGLYYRYGKVIIRDLGSRNGTRVNHQKVKKVVLRDGDRIMLGCTELIFKITGSGLEM